jgi:hypothetical protein
MSWRAKNGMEERTLTRSVGALRMASGMGSAFRGPWSNLYLPVGRASSLENRAAAVTPGGVVPALASFGRGSAGAALLEDEGQFLDLQRCAIWFTDDHPILEE